MPQKIGFWAWVALSAVGIAAIVAVVRLDDDAFCFSERRFLSDGEKIEAATGYAGRGRSVKILVGRADGPPKELIVRAPRYETAAEFPAANPGCCRMAGPESPAELIDVVWAERHKRRPEQGVVVVDMAVPFVDPDGNRRTATFRTNIAVNPCGKVESDRMFKRVARLIDNTGERRS